jgi:hypothetical protein
VVRRPGRRLVAVWPPPAGAGAAGGGAWAWVHVAPTGAVTAFAGKVDVGQDNQTAFRDALSGGVSRPRQDTGEREQRTAR